MNHDYNHYPFSLITPFVFDRLLYLSIYRLFTPREGVTIRIKSFSSLVILLTCNKIVPFLVTPYSILSEDSLLDLLAHCL